MLAYVEFLKSLPLTQQFAFKITFYSSLYIFSLFTKIVPKTAITAIHTDP